MQELRALGGDRHHVSLLLKLPVNWKEGRVRGPLAVSHEWKFDGDAVAPTYTPTTAHPREALLAERDGTSQYFLFPN